LRNITSLENENNLFRRDSRCDIMMNPLRRWAGS
jgi:hypothetical protein